MTSPHQTPSSFPAWISVMPSSVRGLFVGVVGLLSFAVPSLAAAGAMSHEYYSRGRSPYGSNLYLSQQAHYARTTTLAEVSQGSADGVKASEGGDYRGHALQTSLGFEHFRFLQTGLFYSNATTSAAGGTGDGFSGHEFGAEARIVLTSPVVNVGLGGGAYLTRKEMERGLAHTSLQGSGYRGVVDFTYFCSPRVSLLASVSQSVETLSNRTSGAAVGKVEARSLRAGGGIAIWL